LCADRLSGLWGATTPLNDYLVTHGITTLFFGGVNRKRFLVVVFVGRLKDVYAVDQCVFGTM
jgi:hypothetical protein